MRPGRPIAEESAAFKVKYRPSIRLQVEQCQIIWTRQRYDVSAVARPPGRKNGLGTGWKIGNAPGGYLKDAGFLKTLREHDPLSVR